MIWKSTWSYRAAAPIIGYTIIGFFGPVVSLIIVAGMSNVGGQTKKGLMAANIFVVCILHCSTYVKKLTYSQAYCLGNIVGPNLIKSPTKVRHYPELWLGLIICYCILIVTSCLWYAYLRSQNKKREKLDLKAEMRDELAFRDLTDDENPYFRYVL
jgi:hypothetical protein